MFGLAHLVVLGGVFFWFCVLGVLFGVFGVLAGILFFCIVGNWYFHRIMCTFVFIFDIISG